MEDKAVVILDYNNIFTQDNDNDANNLQFLLTMIIDEIINNYNSVGNIVIRAYGGWYNQDGLTNKGSMIQQKLGAISTNLFPVPNGSAMIRGTLELAEQMYGVEGVWNNTYREKEGLPRLIMNKSVIDRTECEKDESRDVCPINILKRFSKRNNERSKPKICHISNCKNSSNVFNQLGQKMVDSIMVCDILTYGEDETTKVIYVITDDVDLFPAVVLCSKKKDTVDLIIKIKNERQLVEYTNYLHAFNSNIKIEKL